MLDHYPEFHAADEPSAVGWLVFTVAFLFFVALVCALILIPHSFWTWLLN